jgi:anti-sigma factor ChrR (cupin superfamily)
MNKLAAVWSGFGVLGLAMACLAAEPAHMGAHHEAEAALYTASELKWKNATALPPGASMAVLEGDPGKEGPFLLRLRFPDGYHIPPHTHPKVERVTILSGTFHLAMGDKLERSVAQALPSGSYGYWPAGMKHAAWTQGETIVQVHGTGPWAINYVNPADDPRLKK